MSMVSNLPAIPDTDYSNYTLSYLPDTGQYRITFFDDLIDNHLKFSCLYYGNCMIYTLDENSDDWNYQGNYLANTRYDFFTDSNRDRNLIGSTVTIYDDNGDVFCYGSSVPYTNGIPFIAGLSGSDFASVLGELWTVTPFLLIVVLGLVGFRKVWGFLHNLIRGA